jgi:hypothetical protein
MTTMKRLVRAVAVLAFAVGGTAVAAAPASASDMPGFLCITNQNTWLRTDPWGSVLRTIEPGRGFRAHIISGGSDRQNWYYGHGADVPWQDGWIPAANCSR